MKQTNKTSKTMITCAAGLLTSSMLSSAAVIAWGAATDTTAATNVSTNGTLVQANAENNVASTVNGVTFAASNSLGTINAGQLNGGTTGDAGFDTLLDNLSFGGGTSTTIDLGAFTSGNVYEVQVFYTDQRVGGLNDRVMTYGSSTGGGTVDLEADPNNAAGSPFGQFAIGTFTADGTDPDLSLATNGFGNAHITAWQVRDITPVPEPSSTALLGLGGVALILRRRK